ncbi:hypothetical protein A3F37_03060 [Candidatus Saccharibacteria bacterium RIFCSPHIGHO2_12_FULL_41_12]|nr:MAG: hypothetical protein A3F37_03060 [Candidatus Saccharibacteria bacterium RIFCSPHIGHO2_12_FULL_41_12]
MTAKKKQKTSFEIGNLKDFGFHNSYSLHNKDQQIVIIMLSDLKLRLIQFKSNVVKTQIMPLLVATVAYWVPFFTSDFKSILGQDPAFIKGCYFILGVIVTLVTLNNIVVTVWKKYLLRLFPRLRINEGITILESRRFENDPEKYAENLLEDLEN